MFKLMGKEINAILGAQTILIWIYELIEIVYILGSICSDTGIQGGKNQRKLSTTGKVVIGVSGAIFVGVCAVTSPFLSPALRKVCLPYVPATTSQVGNVIASLKGRKGSVLDIGSGDGRIVSYI